MTDPQLTREDSDAINARIRDAAGKNPGDLVLARDVHQFIAGLDREIAELRAALDDKPTGLGEEEWAIRVVAEPGGTYWYHHEASSNDPEQSLAITLEVLADGRDLAGNPVPHGPVSIVKRTVWSTEWETVKSVPEDRFGTTATQHDPSRAFHQGTEDEVRP